MTRYRSVHRDAWGRGGKSEDSPTIYVARWKSVSIFGCCQGRFPPETSTVHHSNGPRKRKLVRDGDRARGKAGNYFFFDRPPSFDGEHLISSLKSPQKNQRTGVQWPKLHSQVFFFFDREKRSNSSIVCHGMVLPTSAVSGFLLSYKSGSGGDP
jgi:hypothetical protein